MSVAAQHMPSPPPGLVRAAFGVLLVLVAWQLLAMAMDGSFLLAGPVAITVYLVENAGLMMRALGVTLWSAALGFVLGNLAAIALAALATLFPRIAPTVATLALVVFCLPLVATGPILRVLFGPGIGPQVTLAALACYYTTFVPLLVGMRAAPSAWFDLVSSYGHGPWAKLVHIRAMASLPYLLAGLQIAAPAAFLGAMIGEFTGAERGMGVLAIRAMRALDVDATWALATIASAVAICVYFAVGIIGSRLCPDRPTLILSTSGQSTDTGSPARLVTFAMTIGTILTLWYGLMWAFDLNRFFAKRPDDLWVFFVTDRDAAQHRAMLFGALSDTLIYTVPGYLAGLLLGAALAAVFVTWPIVAGVALPVAVALRAIPIVTTAPLIVLALGRGEVGTITIVAMMIFFPTLVACMQGLKQTPGQVMDVFDTYCTPRWTRLRLAQVPAMLPAFFASARMAVPAAVLAVTVAEWLATGTGIGNLMALSSSTSDYNMLWGATLVLTLVSCLAYWGVGRIAQCVLMVYAPEQVAR